MVVWGSLIWSGRSDGGVLNDQLKKDRQTLFQ
jgi:hypothetical protein